MRSRGHILQRWTRDQALDLYAVRAWSGGFFDISEQGELTVLLPGPDGTRTPVSLMDILSDEQGDGLDFPILLRFSDVLESRIRHLNGAFGKAMRQAGYRGCYRGVYPVKVNQQEQVVDEVCRYGRKFHHGLEVGSKAELLAAMACMHDPESFIVCNGYKDEEFVDLALQAAKAGLKPVLVIEMPGEAALIRKRAELHGVRPLLGVRLRISSRGGGHWTESGGDHSVFGLDCAQVVSLVDELTSCSLLDCLVMLHYHLGSQVPNIRDLRSAAAEAMRVYVDLISEGAPMGCFNAGGGLAVDYDGSRTNFASSSNYSLDEYCADLVDVVMSAADQAGADHPVIVTESGRALVAYSSVLLFNILDVARFERHDPPPDVDESSHEMLRNLAEVGELLSVKKLQEAFHDALYYRDEIRAQFQHASMSLRERADGEHLFWSIMIRIAREVDGLAYVPDELRGLEHALADVYYGNFSVFQSLPDAWAIDQLFPVMPIHRLNEEPTRRAILADSTCDCDGKIDRFIGMHEVGRVLAVHPLRGQEDYVMGVFLVGAYQETLGDLHNLFGDTNVMGVRLGADGGIERTRTVQGDTVAEVLSYVEYDPRVLAANFGRLARRALDERRITPDEHAQMVAAYERGLRGYTYFERPSGD